MVEANPGPGVISGPSTGIGKIRMPRFTRAGFRVFPAHFPLRCRPSKVCEIYAGPMSGNELDRADAAAH